MLMDVDHRIFCLRLPPDTWSMATVLSHFTAVERQNYQRLRRVLDKERPILPVILPNLTSHNLQASATGILARFQEARPETLAYLKDVADDGWARAAVHGAHGEGTFHFLVQSLLAHAKEHLNQIITMQQQLNAVPERKVQPAISE